MGDWCTIESDPGVFTELIRKIGVTGAEVTEIYSLDLLSQVSPVHGLIFLFKWEPKPGRSCEDFYDNDLFFAQQVIQNACATQAILSVILNSKLEIGEELSKFKEFAMSLQPSDRGLVLSNSELIRTTHNSFAQQEPFEFIQSKKEKKGDAYHFVSFIHFKGKIFELDGLQKGPINHGECSENEWVEKVTPIIQARMEEFSGSEIRFNLMAIVNSKRDLLKKTYRDILMKVVAIKTKLMSLDAEVEGDEMECEFNEEYFALLSDDVNELLEELKVNTRTMKNAKEDLDLENFKYAKWKEENQRRKHDYIPFIINLLQKVAEKQKLIPLLDAAKERDSKSKAK
jgi:ubiquitin carboxyl-terminal hydrolase L5